MIRSIPRRTILSSLVALPAALALAACSDSGEDKAAEAAKPAEPAAAAPAETAAPAKPAVTAPPSQGTVDMAKLLEAGALPSSNTPR
jgi:hypothetical protein